MSGLSTIRDGRVLGFLIGFNRWFFSLDVPMPTLIEHIDAIARKKGRDVLFLVFSIENDDDMNKALSVDWDSLPIRKQVISWLDQNHIAWYPCGLVANENVVVGYLGRIYIDVTFDQTDPVYQKLADYLETPDGEMKLPGVEFCYLPLEIAMKNVHHDEPGFWDRWAEKFWG